MAAFEDHLPIVAVSDLICPDAEGYLEKKRKDKKFRSEKLQKRWCVIHGGNFYYFSKCTDTRQKGGFSLTGYAFQKLGTLSFAVVCKGKRPFEFVAPSKDEVEKFRKAIVGVNATRKTLKKSDSYPGVESAPPLSPTRDRSISIPTDKKSDQMTYKSKTRSHTPEPYQRSPNTSSRNRSNTLGRSVFDKTKADLSNSKLQKTVSSPFVDRSTGHKQRPPPLTRSTHDIDEYGYANVCLIKKGLSPAFGGGNNEYQTGKQYCSSSEDSESDYDTVPESILPKPAPRHKQVEKLLSISAPAVKRKMSLDRQKIPAPGLTTLNHESSDDEKDYDSPEDLPLRPESDYDFVGQVLPKRTESCFDTQDNGEDDMYIDASKLDSVPNRKQRSDQNTKAPSHLGTQQTEDDIYFEPTSECGQVKQVTPSQKPNVFQADDDDPYFIPIEESGHSTNDEPPYFLPNSGDNRSGIEDENPYFEPISDYDMIDVAKSPVTETKPEENDGYTKVTGNTKVRRTSSRNSDGYSKPGEIALLKRKPATAAATNTKGKLFTDDSEIYVNLPFAIPQRSRMKQADLQTELSNKVNSKNTMKLQNMKLKDSVDDSSYSDSDDLDYSEI